MAHHDKQNPKMDEKGKQQMPNRGPQAPGQPAPNREEQMPGQPQQTPRQPDKPKAPEPSRGERSDKDSIGQPVQLDRDRA